MHFGQYQASSAVLGQPEDAWTISAYRHIQNNPLCRTYFGQYQASSAVLEMATSLHKVQTGGWPYPKGRQKFLKSTLSLCSCYSKILLWAIVIVGCCWGINACGHTCMYKTSEGTRTNNSMNWSWFKWTVNTRLFYNSFWNELNGLQL